MEPSLLPDLGIDVSAYAVEMGTYLGLIFVTLLGVASVFIASKIGWKWLKRIGN